MSLLPYHFQAGNGDSSGLPVRLPDNGGSTPSSPIRFTINNDGTFVPIRPRPTANIVDNTPDPRTNPSIPIAGRKSPFTKLPVDLLFCIMDFLQDRKDKVNLSATRREIRIWLYDKLAHQDLRSGRLVTLRSGLRTQNMRAIEPFFDFYRELITRVDVIPKEDLEPKSKKVKGKKDHAVKFSIFKDPAKNKGKAGTAKEGVKQPVRARKAPSKPTETIISFRDENLPSLRLIRPILTSALEKALLAHDLTFAEHLLWHAKQDLMPSLTPVLESVLWSALDPDTCLSSGETLDHLRRQARTGGGTSPVTPIVWTWNTCPLAAVKLLVKFGAKGNRAGVWPEEKKTRRRRANPPPEGDENTDTPGLYDGYYHSKTQTPAAHAHMPPMPPRRLWTGLERVAFFYEEAYGRSEAANVVASAAATTPPSFADSGVDVSATAASAGGAPVAKSRGIKRNFSGSFHNPGLGSKPSPNTGKEHRLLAVTCESHDGKEGESCFKKLLEVLCESIIDEEAFRASTLGIKKKRTRGPKAPILEDSLENMLKKTETTVVFAEMLISEQAGKLFKEIFEGAGKTKFEVLHRFMAKGTRQSKQMKTENMTEIVHVPEGVHVPAGVGFPEGVRVPEGVHVPEVVHEEEDFWAEDMELDLEEGEPEEDE
ncbi:hypothetical protein SMACR_03539 [Sordaria macrospora]|uniref:WGS project CABT00000000 data, contig 2.9 n=2 Tax=Sordaria macrospora TaxID=5147 RepID=F7VVG7_SORMK|nr:uncharacterized protein SMAC_03539 [Sordaria macrospora k-hell]KAA8636173.1 hypothetical protein SMACR_03539 [Sordaria macrospora]WPJ65934.1 hypothetical protein SMAC4_03539 [Sordaria macrospora]CCC09508.1 unnamed protein product [Sordaria macrospora k-hell]